MSPEELAGKIDHTILKPEASEREVLRVVEEAIQFKFASVCVAGRFVARVAGELRGSGVKTCSVIGFPHGNTKATMKAIEGTAAIKDGAEEIDLVAHLPALLALDFDVVKGELLEVARAARATRPDAVIKVIVESALLMRLGDAEKAIALACRAVRESGCDFIKTSTGFHPAGGASVEAVGLMHKHAQGIQVKAAGGIRDWPTAKAMLEAGADRLGLSASLEIVKQAAEAV